MFIFKCDGCYIQDFTGTEGGEADGEALRLCDITEEAAWDKLANSELVRREDPKSLYTMPNKGFAVVARHGDRAIIVNNHDGNFALWSGKWSFFSRKYNLRARLLNEKTEEDKDREYLDDHVKEHWLRTIGLPSLHEKEPENARTIEQLLDAGDVTAAEQDWNEVSEVPIGEELPDTPSKPGEVRCAYLGCKNPVNPDEDHCHGCGYIICEEHSTNPGLMGYHDVVEHWDFDEDEEDLWRTD